MRDFNFTLVRVSNRWLRRASGQVDGIIEFGLRTQGTRRIGGCKHILARGSERARAWRRRRRRSKASAHFERSALPLENSIN